MRHLVLVGSLTAAIATAAACGGDASPGAVGNYYDAGASALDDGGGVATYDGDIPPLQDGGAGTGGNTGLPCDVQKVIEDSCLSCHYKGGQSPPLNTYADLTAQSAQYPGQSVAQRSLARLKAVAPATPMPPPPSNAPTAAEIAAFQSWVNAGTPLAPACTTIPDGGAPPPPQACPNGVNTPASGGGGQMHPGQACNACHQRSGGGDAPRFALGGTVFSCAGTSPAATVKIVITDANGKVSTLPILANGNFCSDGRCNAPGLVIAPPFNVKIVDGAKTRAMAGSITAGDCNLCHTATGANGAPGRILAP